MIQLNTRKTEWRQNRLSKATPKGWTRRCPELDQGYAERIHAALKPSIAKGAIIDAAIYHDARGRLRRVQALYESGWLVCANFSADDDSGFIEEFAPKVQFTIKVKDVAECAIMEAP